jgi:hypothetical protein
MVADEFNEIINILTKFDIHNNQIKTVNSTEFLYKSKHTHKIMIDDWQLATDPFIMY